MSLPNQKLWLRPDLVQREVCLGNDRMWVVKDPLSREFLYFNQQEHVMLSLANGKRSLAEISQECSKRFAPEYFSSDAVLRFFAGVRDKGLLVAGEFGGRKSKSASCVAGWWRNPLAIRLPGFHPDRLLALLEPICRPLLSRLAMGLAVILVIVAAVLAVVHFAELASHFSIAISRVGLGQAGVMLLVIGVTKVVHELAHAIACRHFGGECREMGVMLLVGVPCLYCDVSDVWTMRERWKRVVVSGAGIMAEVVIASAALFVWLATIDGPLRDLCVIVIAVCSVSTILLNGNPLLRYDGYYIASDLLGIPNLAAESSHMVKTMTRRFLWGIPVVAPSGESKRTLRSGMLFAYWIASMAYRWTLYTAILWMVYLAAERNEMGVMAGVMLLGIVAMVAYRGVRNVLTPPSRSARQSSLAPQRPRMAVLGIAVFVLVLASIPLPHHVTAPMSIEAGKAVTVVTPFASHIEYAVESGSNVRRGDVVAKLQSFSIERDVLTIRSECERLESQLESVRRQRTADASLSSKLPMLEKMLEEAQRRKQLREAEAAELTILAPIDGVVFSPPTTSASPMDVRLVRSWSGTPLDAANQGAWLASGTEICVIGDPTRREAMVLVREHDVELVRIGQEVSLLVEGWPGGSITGTVSAVADSPVDRVADQISSFEARNTAPVNDTRPLPRYLVRVELDSTGDGLPVRLVARAIIQVDSTSIFNRAARFLRESLKL